MSIAHQPTTAFELPAKLHPGQIAGVLLDMAVAAHELAGADPEAHLRGAE